ncbi:MAG: CDP-diacylglycerol--glycerol-3-phosphate 3-phosphatidyltransferase [Candidatus Adiutrix sp.]|jgi:CDP-diacylglycerol--glycerol-3-phosphate 3-phosphatidyltransferase|nr:CDP-diacylglycerol--glycerol-3-phosphate 3-phosphatidyltransferase [Candidatus Adiutrix sp.]
MNWNKLLSHPQMPNIITISRLTAVPVIVILLTLYPDGAFWVSALTATVFLLAALTDLADGHLARKYNLVSNLGKFLDPLADKLLISAALIMLIPLGRAPAWVAFLIIAREMAVTGLRAIAAERGLIISASESGKRKTLAQNIALFCLMWHHQLLWADTAAVGLVILYLALIITYWSGGLYFYEFLKVTRPRPGGAGQP